MKEKTLLKIALICTIVGLIVLYFISSNITIQEVDLSRIDETDIGDDIKLIGRVEKVSDVEKVMFLDVGQQKIESISVILFKDSDIAISEGDYVEIIGEIEEYEGERQVIANKVRLI